MIRKLLMLGWIFLISCTSVEAERDHNKTITFSVPKMLLPRMQSVLPKRIGYTGMSVKTMTVDTNRDALLSLREHRADFALVRSDILWHLQRKELLWGNLTQEYITLSTLPFFSTLYLVQSAQNYDAYLSDLSGKRISVGSMGEGNGHMLKTLMRLLGAPFRIHYLSVRYASSLVKIRKGELDGFLGFLPSAFENDDFHFQTLFSREVTEWAKAEPYLKVDYDGIHVPWTIVAATWASDEAIENVLYSLSSRKIFSPQTDGRYGTVDRYVNQHMNQVRFALRLRAEQEAKAQMEEEPLPSKGRMGRVCLQYHYGFLKLLRRKPHLKRRARRSVAARKILGQLESILIAIDRKKNSCDLSYLRSESDRFNRMASHI